MSNVRTQYVFRVWNIRRRYNVFGVFLRLSKVIGCGQSAYAPLEAFLNKLWFFYFCSKYVLCQRCFLLLVENISQRKKWEWFCNDRSKAGSNYWQGMEAVMEWNWFYHPLTLKSIIKGQILLFENCFGFALRPHFPWAALCFWQPSLAQELPDAFAELFFDFMKKSDTSSRLSFSLSPKMTCVTV